MKVEWELEDWENQGTQEARTEKERKKGVKIKYVNLRKITY